VTSYGCKPCTSSRLATRSSEASASSASAVEASAVEQDVEQPFEAAPVEVGHQPDELLGPLPRERSLRRARVEQRRDALPGCRDVAGGASAVVRQSTVVRTSTVVRRSTVARSSTVAGISRP
jgi:hypothetical protein